MALSELEKGDYRKLRDGILEEENQKLQSEKNGCCLGGKSNEMRIMTRERSEKVD
jgi:hypothetical protein